MIELSPIVRLEDRLIPEICIRRLFDIAKVLENSCETAEHMVNLGEDPVKWAKYCAKNGMLPEAMAYVRLQKELSSIGMIKVILVNADKVLKYSKKAAGQQISRPDFKDQAEAMKIEAINFLKNTHRNSIHSV